MKVEIAPSFFESIKNIGSLKNKYYEIRAWIRYHFNKDFWLIVKTAFKGYPWQETFLYELERAKIQEMINYHKKYKRFVGVEYVIRDMELAVKMLDIMLDETEFFHYDGDMDFVKNEDGTYSIENNSTKYVCDVKVNTRNVDRFSDNVYLTRYMIEHPHELYILKAKHLYHKIRFEKDDTWWD